MQHKFIRLPQVKSITGKSKTSIYKDIKEGTFPKQYPNGRQSVAWLESDIQKWIEGKIVQSVNANDNVKSSKS